MSITDWRFEGSNDGTAWVQLDVQTNQDTSQSGGGKVYQLGCQTFGCRRRLSIAARNEMHAREDPAMLTAYRETQRRLQAEEPTFPEGFRFIKHEQSCVGGLIWDSFANSPVSAQSISECGKMCSEETSCVGFEYGVDHGGVGLPTVNYQSRDCVLSNNNDIGNCDGATYNLDFYELNKAPPQPSGTTCAFLLLHTYMHHAQNSVPTDTDSLTMNRVLGQVLAIHAKAIPRVLLDSNTYLLLRW